MRVLALETTSNRGSVALVEGSCNEDVQIVTYLRHEEANRQAERLLGLMGEALKEAKWDKRSLDRIAVGVGPGSFTGVRIGIAQAQGLMLGLGVPAVGVGSLRVIAAGLEPRDERLRVVVRDARREEYFVAAYDSEGKEVVAPHTIEQEKAEEVLARRFEGYNFVVLGTVVGALPSHINDETGAPDARALGRVAVCLDPENEPAVPHYLRGPRVVRPNLPPSPLLLPRISKE